MASAGAGKEGLYTAYYLNMRWHGNMSNPSVEDMRQSGASLFLVKRILDVNRELALDPAFTDLTPDLKKLPGRVGEFPLRVYRFDP
jgi:hypothetical protein